MRLSILSLGLLISVAAPAMASLGEINITSYIIIERNVGEVLGTVQLNGQPAAIVTVNNGGAKYSTLTDANGKWSVLTAVRSNTVEATARQLDGQGAPVIAEAA